MEKVRNTRTRSCVSLTDYFLINPLLELAQCNAIGSESVGPCTTQPNTFTTGAFRGRSGFLDLAGESSGSREWQSVVT